MRYSHLCARTLRAAPAGVTRPAEQLALRAALVRKLDSGEWVFLPLGARVLARMQTRVRAHFAPLHAQEILLPRNAIADAIRAVARGAQSFRDLPATLYAFTAHPPALDLFHLGGTDSTPIQDCLVQLLRDAGLSWRAGDGAFFVESDNGDARLLACPACGAMAAESLAPRAQDAPSTDARLPIEEMETPNCSTIESLAQFLNIPTRQTAKAMFYVADGALLFAVIRGDLTVSEAKLRRALGISSLRLATEDEIKSVGAVPGYASPLGLKGVRVVADTSVAAARNLVAGVNRAGYHLKNTNLPRDYTPEHVIDFAQVRAGDLCWNCGAALAESAGFQVLVFQSIESDLKYLTENGTNAPLGITRYHLDLQTLFFAMLDRNRDDKGILFPRAFAPFDVHLVALNVDKPEVAPAAMRVCGELESRGLAVLYDDRAESAGVKFNDADLIGCPVRVVISPRALAQNAAEVKRRAEQGARVVKLDEVGSVIGKW